MSANNPLQIPFSGDHLPNAGSDSAGLAPSEKPKVLLLDDEERILKSLNAIFRFKYQVFATTDGHEALEIIERERPHLVISDQRMPKMSGVDFLRQAKIVCPNTIRILLTGYSDLASIIGSINDGEVYRFVNKPWGNQEIQAIVADAVAIGIQLARTPTSPEPLAVVDNKEDVLVVDDNEANARQIIEILGNVAKCHLAKSVDDALLILQAHPVAIIVADLKPGSDDKVVLFKLLKQEHPQILTIVMADYSDSTKLIELINQAKIYRYLIKPIKLKMLHYYVNAAIKQYRAYNAQPVLLNQQKPEDHPEQRQTAPSRTILRVLHSLRNRFFVSRL